MPNDIDKYVVMELSKLADFIFTHTETMRVNAEIIFNREVTNHGFGTDNLINIADTNTPIPKDNYTFEFLGNVRDYKNIEFLMKSFCDIKESISSINLVIIGPDYNNYLKDLLNKYDDYASKNIHIINGFISDPIPYINKMDICICCYNLTFPQFQYGFYPSSIANLGKMGKPLICPHCDSVLYIIEQR